jgi:hypothetical protein
LYARGGGRLGTLGRARRYALAFVPWWNLTIEALAKGEMQATVRNIHEAIGGAARHFENIAIVNVAVQKQCCAPVNGIFESGDILRFYLPSAILVFVPTNVRLTYEAARNLFVVGETEPPWKCGPLPWLGLPIGDRRHVGCRGLSAIFYPVANGVLNFGQSGCGKRVVSAIMTKHAEVTDDHIGAQLSDFRVAGDFDRSLCSIGADPGLLRRIDTSSHDHYGHECINSNTYSRDLSPTEHFPFVSSATTLCGFILFLERLYR